MEDNKVPINKYLRRFLFVWGIGDIKIVFYLNKSQ